MYSGGSCHTSRPLSLQVNRTFESTSTSNNSKRSGAPTPKRRESLPNSSPGAANLSSYSSEGASASYGPVLKHPRHSFGTNRIMSNLDSGTSSGRSRHVFEAKSQHKESFKLLHEFYDTGELCDLELQCGKKTFKCHKIVLACVSKYFRSMFQSDMVESRQSSVTIKDIDENAMKSIIEFAYTAKVSMDVDDVQNLLYASSILQVEAVAFACCDFMKAQLDPQNCIGVRTFAEQHGRTDLVRKTDQYILANFQDVVNSEEFVAITPKTLISLVASSDLNVITEVHTYEAVMRWVKYDKEARKQYLADLLANIRFPRIPVNYLIETICKEELVRSNERCRDIIDEAKVYYMSVTQDVPSAVRIKALPRKSYAGVVFCVGGRGTSGDPFKSIECYDIRRDKWFAVADMSTKRRHVGVVSFGGKLFAVGGHDGVEHLGSGEVYDPVKNTWTPIASMSTLRRGLAVACLPGGPMYALGGLDDNTCYNTVERYDPESNTWSQVQEMKYPRGGVAVASMKNYLYAVGGNDGAASLDSCERYDPHLNKWTEMANMNKRRAGAGCAELGGVLYVVGGFDDNAPLDSVEKYDAATNSWHLVKKMSCPRGGVGVAALGGKIYAVGGHDGSNYLNSVESYDPVTDSWSPIGKISSCRAGAGVAFCDVYIGHVVDSLSKPCKNSSMNIGVGCV